MKERRQRMWKNIFGMRFIFVKMKIKDFKITRRLMAIHCIKWTSKVPRMNL